MEDKSLDSIEDKVITDVISIDTADTSTTLHQYDRFRDKDKSPEDLTNMLESYLKRKQLTINFIRDNINYE